MVTEDISRRVRQRVHDFLEMGVYGHRGGRIFDVLMIGLIIANVIAVAAETVPDLGARYQSHFLAFEVLSVGVFSLEYLLRLWVAVEVPVAAEQPAWRIRLKYAMTPLAVIDLLAVLPFYLLALTGPDLRFLRIFRLVRLLKLVRYSTAVGSIARVVYAERRALIAALVIMLGMLLLSSSIMYFVERAAQPEAFGSIPKALWWAITTLTTVGYGDVVPLTGGGRLVGGLVMIFGLVFYALPIGIVASAFSSEIHRRDFVVRYGLVAKVPLFQGLDPETISEISRLLRSITVERGGVISYEGQVAEGMYFLVSGEAMAEIGGRKVTLRSGRFFGEISLIRGGFREATVVAQSRCQLMLLESHDFRHLLMMRPELRTRLWRMVHQHLDELIEQGELSVEDRGEILERHRRTMPEVDVPDGPPQD